MSTHRRRLLLCALLPAACVPTAVAGAAGLPLPSSASGRAGAVTPAGTERVLTRRAGADTVVVAVRRGDGGVLRSRRVRGRWTVPAVTLNNGTTGLSADGRTLVLARPTLSFPAAATPLAVLDARRLVVRRHIRLTGFFTVDAISPDGRWLYLIQYADNVLDYRVRALDTRSGRLAARDVVDPRSPGEQMGGMPMTRAMSRDGRWAYTLYGGGTETFIHALDTVGRTAACVDLGMLPPDSDLSAVRLHVSPDGRSVSVSDDTGLRATVDARTFAVSEPGSASARPASPRRALAPPADGEGFPWLTVLLAAGAISLGVVAVVAARRRGNRAIA